MQILEVKAKSYRETAIVIDVQINDETCVFKAFFLRRTTHPYEFLFGSFSRFEYAGANLTCLDLEFDGQQVEC